MATLLDFLYNLVFITLGSMLHDILVNLGHFAIFLAFAGVYWLVTKSWEFFKGIRVIPGRQ